MTLTTNSAPDERADLAGWLQASNARLVVVAFVTDWAGGALILKGFLEHAERELGEAVLIQFIDADDQPDLTNDLGVNHIPTTVLLRDQTIVDHIDGVIPKRKLLERMAPYV